MYTQHHPTEDQMQDTFTFDDYAARLDIDYPERLNRLTTLLRVVWAIPILIILGLVMGPGYSEAVNEAGEVVHQSLEFSGGLGLATALMIVFRRRYPRWWFDFARELLRFQTRVFAYLFLLTDRYPSTEDRQAVRLDIDYPDVRQGLNRWLPLIKWLLALPHYIVLFVLFLGVALAVIAAWFTILFTGNYPRGLFNFVVGAFRWGLRVNAYAFLLVTDKYPPFSLR
jgi:hypothetical protein